MTEFKHENPAPVDTSEEQGNSTDNDIHYGYDDDYYRSFSGLLEN